MFAEENYHGYIYRGASEHEVHQRSTVDKELKLKLACLEEVPAAFIPYSYFLG